jgi:hypothetical protein
MTVRLVCVRAPPPTSPSTPPHPRRQAIAKRGGYGAYMLENLDNAVAIVKHLHENLSVPVTCKIRLLPDIEDSVRVAKALQAAGAQLITVHGRTKEQNKVRALRFACVRVCRCLAGVCMMRLRHWTPCNQPVWVAGCGVFLPSTRPGVRPQDYMGPCDWDGIRRIKSELTVPVIANGGIGRMSDVARCLEVWCCGVVRAWGWASSCSPPSTRSLLCPWPGCAVHWS